MTDPGIDRYKKLFSEACDHVSDEGVFSDDQITHLHHMIFAIRAAVESALEDRR